MENTFDNNATFNTLGIAPPILKALDDLGFELPTEVQSRAIPHILNKKDMVVMSKTGSGKTAVFGVSMLQLTDPDSEGPQGLILTPTRELAVQVDSDIRQMAKHLTHKTTAVYGQHSMNAELQALNKGVTIVTGTPGRVYDHIQHGNLKTKHIRFLVLDEADRMLDMGFIDQVEKIIRTIPKDRVTLLFSATIPNEIKRICSRYMKEPETMEIESQTKTVDAIRQLYYRIERNEKRTQLNRLLMAERPESCMIFCNTRIAVDQVRSFLYRKGYACQSLHGDIPQAKRMKTIDQFKRGEFHILVATDVAARGIHIEDLSLVINYDVPVERDSYVHRIGRTGRAGHEGRAISIVSSDDIMSLYEIEEHIGAMIQESELPTEAFLAKHKLEIDEWKKSNEAKPGSEGRPARSKSGSGNRNRPKPFRERSSDTKNTRTNKSGTPDGQSRTRYNDTDGTPKSRIKEKSSHQQQNQSGGKSKKKYDNTGKPQRRYDDNTGRPYQRKGPNAANRQISGINGSGEAPQRRNQDVGKTQDASRQKRRDYANRQPNSSNAKRPYSASNNKAANTGAVQKQAVAGQTQKPAEKKGILRRMLDRVFGK